jgi:phage-related tail protein
MTDFNPEQSLKEEVSALADIHASLKKRANALAAQYGEIEHEFNQVNKLLGYAAIELDRKRQALAVLLKGQNG